MIIAVCSLRSNWIIPCQLVNLQLWSLEDLEKSKAFHFWTRWLLEILEPCEKIQYNQSMFERSRLFHACSIYFDLVQIQNWKNKWRVSKLYAVPYLCKFTSIGTGIGDCPTLLRLFFFNDCRFPWIHWLIDTVKHFLPSDKMIGQSTIHPQIITSHHTLKFLCRGIIISLRESRAYINNSNQSNRIYRERWCKRPNHCRLLRSLFFLLPRFWGYICLLLYLMNLLKQLFLLWMLWLLEWC